MKLGHLDVGGASPCRVVAEIAQGHDGSLGTAHAYIDAVAAAGADAIKFQTHIADAESTPSEPFRIKFSKQDASRYDYWKRMEFTEPQWAGLIAHAQEKGLLFMSSAFSMQAVELLERIGVKAWKVGAGEVTNQPMLRRMAKTGPVILSTGMSTWSELDAAVETVRAQNAEVAVLQCTTAYPCPPEKLGLNVMAELRQRYSSVVGLSDHSGVIYSGLAAAALGAELLEVHVVFSKECFGPDTVASITTPDLAKLVEGVRFIKSAQNHPVDKEGMAAELGELRRLFTKSIVAVRRLETGHRIAETDLALKKPGTGLPANRMDDVIGKRLRRAIEKDEQIVDEVLE